MKAQDVLKSQLNGTQQFLARLVNDLSDADFQVRPVDKANTIAWQMGHLIAAEQTFGKENLPGVQYPALPPGFAEQHTNATAAVEPPKGFLSKAQYMDLFNATRAATIAAVGKMSEADFDKPTTGRMAQFCPTVGHIAGLLASHTLMHAGQFTVLRRKLGKPVLM
jgi:hypothetical protein